MVGNDLQFRMEDTYRTHDEIEVPAESFAMLSGKTFAYIIYGGTGHGRKGTHRYGTVAGCLNTICFHAEKE